MKWLLVMVLVLQTLGMFQAPSADAVALSTTRASVHDPSVVKGNGKYYIFGTHMVNAESSNLASWSNMTTSVNNNYASVFSVGAAWAAQGSSNYNLAGNLWAPTVFYN